MTTKGRSLFAALFGTLVLASMFVSPGAPATRLGGALTNAVSTARGVSTPGIGQRESRQRLRTLPRRGPAEQPRWAVGADRPATAVQGQIAAVPGSPTLVTPPAAAIVTAGEPTVQVSGRMPGARRDRAPPVLALA